MLKFLSLGICLVVLQLVVVQVYAEESEYCWTILCSSHNFKDDSCPADFTYLKDFIQISKTDCIKNETFFIEEGEIFVVDGCRAYFEVCINYETACAKVNCSSWDFEPETCLTPLPNIDSIEIEIQESETTCIANENYFTSGNYIKVDDGCRAIFDVCYTACPECTCRTVVCESTSLLPNTCSTGGTITSMILEEELSYRVCEADSTYFNQENQIKVTNGCRARFYVCHAPPPECSMCTELRCDSYGKNPKTCTAPWPIDTVAVKTKFSRSDCQPGTSYFFSDDELTVTKGCRALFEICTNDCSSDIKQVKAYALADKLFRKWKTVV